MQYNKKLNKNNSGFSLIELIVTVVILALVTAPFLSSFVTASRTNLKAKRIEAANEISQEIIERFKGSDIDYIKGLYNMHVVNDASGNPTDTFRATIDCSSGVISEYPGYTAKVDLKGGSGVSAANGSSPVIDEIEDTSCAFISSVLFQSDAAAKGDTTIIKRVVNIEISYNETETKYHVNTEVAYCDVFGNQKMTGPVIDYACDDVPVVYILYKQYSTSPGNSDRIYISNYLTDDQLDGGNKKLPIYFINQSGYGNILDASNVFISEASVIWAPRFSLKAYNKELTGIYNNLSRTTINTNILSSISGENINSIVRADNIDYLYELKVEISYHNKVISTYTASKNIVD